jgi:G3E family GTPase
MTRAHVITGSFGSGKTTAIRHLMRSKPADELWVVILNEFTEAGIDALSVAEAASGRYDVRLVAGGCLCCTGELEFGKQLRDILRNFRPTRLLVEPSGAGHAADIVDALSLHEAHNGLHLDSVICLIDALDAARIEAARPQTEWSQIQSADVLLLSKSELAGEAERQAFGAIAAAQYPAKAYLGSVSHGVLPGAALASYSRPAHFSLLGPAAAAAEPSSSRFELAGGAALETLANHLDLWAVQWQLPPVTSFARVILESRLQWLLEAQALLIRRMKGVFRVGPGPSWLVQSSERGLSGEDSAYRRDSRLELVLRAKPSGEMLAAWREMLRDAANP